MKPFGGNNPKPLTENERIKQLLIRIGDDGPNYYKRDITKVSTNLSTFYQNGDKNAKDFVINVLSECVASLPPKAVLYATAVSLISVQNSGLPEALIDKVLEKAKSSLEQGNAFSLKSILMFLGELMNIGLFSGFIYIPVLFDLFHEAENTLETSGDFFLSIGISVLPYVVGNLKEKIRLELNSLVQTVDKLMGQRDKSYVQVSKINKKQESPNTHLDVLWEAIKGYIENGKKTDLTAISRPYEDFQEELANLKELKKNLKINFSAQNPKVCVYQSQPYHTFFDEDLLKQEVPVTLNRALLQEKISDIIISLYPLKKTVVQFLLKIDENYTCPHLIVEGIFDEMFRLPASSSRLIFYTSLLLSLISEAPQSKKENYTKLIHQIPNLIVKNCEDYDVEVLDRLTDWFAHFLSNLNFEWDWSSWKYIAESEPESSEAKLLRAVLAKLVQISFRDRLLEVVPEELKSFLPPAELSYFEYDDSDAPSHADAETIKEKLNSKLTAIEMTQFLQSDENGLEASDDLLLDIFVQSLFHRASKTLTHFNAHLEKYNTTISQLIAKESDQLVILDAVRKLWQSSNFHVLMTIDALDNYKILTVRNIITWIFKSIEKEEDSQNNCRLFWELLFAVLDKVESKLEKLREGLTIEKDNKEQVTKLSKEIESSLEEQKDIFIFVFKKIHHLLTEGLPSNSPLFQSANERFIQVSRKYRREIDRVFAGIEEDFSKTSIPEVSEVVPHLKGIKFPKNI